MQINIRKTRNSLLYRHHSFFLSFLCCSRLSLFIIYYVLIVYSPWYSLSLLFLYFLWYSVSVILDLCLCNFLTPIILPGFFKREKRKICRYKKFQLFLLGKTGKNRVYLSKYISYMQNNYDNLQFQGIYFLNNLKSL